MPSTTVFVYGTEITVNRLLPNNSAEPFLIWVRRVLEDHPCLTCHLQGATVIVRARGEWGNTPDRLEAARAEIVAAAAPFPVDAATPGDFLGDPCLTVRGVS